MAENTVVVDVRPMPPAQRHTTIFRAFDGLASGQSMLLVNDHDPKPLYYQFAAEQAGKFEWNYLQQGPEEWRVEIKKA